MELVVLEVDKNESWSTLCTHSVENVELSLKAKGLHLYLMTRPPGYQINTSDLVSGSLDGKTSLLAGINELISKNYLFRIMRKNEKGRVVEWDYFVSPVPITKEAAAVAIEKLKKGKWEIYESGNL